AAGRRQEAGRARRGSAADDIGAIWQVPFGRGGALSEADRRHQAERLGFMTQIRIPAVYMRGGTSKGVFFVAEDLPSDPVERDRILLRVIGSPDRYGKH